MELDFEIDKLTESIELVETGESFETVVLPVKKEDLKQITKNNGWNFNWKQVFNEKEGQVHKLVIKKEQDVIQGLISFDKDDGFMLMQLIESSPVNLGKDKKYLGVAGNMVAFVCKKSLECGFGGVIAFEPKTALISHYENVLGAVRISERRMAIFEKDAKMLIDKYFPKKEDTL